MSDEKNIDEIQAEIAALKACKFYIPPRTMFGDNNCRKVDLQIQFLEGDIDVTADEFNYFNPDEQSAILEAKDWMEGQIDDSPSSGWDTYKPKKTKKK